MKDLKEWNDDVENTRMDLLNWATNTQNSGMGNVIILGMMGFLVLISYLLGWSLAFRITGILLLLQLARVIWALLKKGYEKIKRKGWLL